MLNLINNQPDIDKLYWYARDSYKAKYQFLISKIESTGLKHFNDSKAFIKNSNDIQNVDENIKEYNRNKERKILIVFDDMILDMINNKRLNSITSELFIRDKKLNISFVLLRNHILSFQKMLD